MDAATIQHDPNAAFNVAHFEASETAMLQVKKQDGSGPLLNKGEPVFIEMYGPGSEQYVMAQVEFERALSDRTMQTALAMNNPSAAKTPEDPAASTRVIQNKKLVRCTKALHNFPIPGGAQALYENHKLGYIRNQVLNFGDSWANFPSASVKD